MRRTLGRAVLIAEQHALPHVVDCPVSWIAVVAKEVKMGLPGTTRIPKGTVLVGFDGRTRRQIEGQIADAVANKDWPAGSLRAKLVVDCRYAIPRR